MAFRSAVWAIRAHPLRTLALTLSLASAVACVVFSASVLGGFSKRLERLAFGDYATTLVVRANGLVPSRRGGPSLDDRARLLDALEGVEGSAAWIATEAPLRGANETRVVRVFGAMGDYRRELDAKLVEGRWLTERELGGLSRVCLLGAALAADLGQAERSLLGSEISLGGPRCRVVGVLDYAETRPAGRFNDAAITPFLTARRYFDMRPEGATPPAGPREASWLSFFMTSKSDMQDVRYKADREMRRAAGVPMSRESPFSYDDPGADILEQARQRDVLARLLWTVTGAALAASLIGYGGVALASTAARRREIALRLAMGADAGNILRQISMEHALVGVFASAVGLLLGLAGSVVAAQVWDWPVHLSWPAGAFSILLGCALGLAIGVFVASRAARTPPSLAARG
ncbi:ABC transporter permease [Caulobacter mirabilis]|nr:ABC transporter permease [Caulobacter mirabilis]